MTQEHRCSLRVRYQETDKMGVVYHGNYFTWFEVGRTEYFRRLGIPYKLFEEEGVAIPVRRINCSYHKPALYDDVVDVVTTLVRLTPARACFKYQVWRDKELLAQAESEHAFINGQGKPIALPKIASPLWEKLREALAGSSGIEEGIHEQ